jgi:hypothetical protein
MLTGMQNGAPLLSIKGKEELSLTLLLNPKPDCSSFFVANFFRAFPAKVLGLLHHQRE